MTNAKDPLLLAQATLSVATLQQFARAVLDLEGRTTADSRAVVTTSSLDELRATPRQGELLLHIVRAPTTEAESDSVGAVVSTFPRKKD